MWLMTNPVRVLLAITAAVIALCVIASVTAYWPVPIIVAAFAGLATWRLTERKRPAPHRDGAGHSPPGSSAPPIE